MSNWRDPKEGDYALPPARRDVRLPVGPETTHDLQASASASDLRTVQTDSKGFLRGFKRGALVAFGIIFFGVVVTEMLTDFRFIRKGDYIKRAELNKSYISRNDLASNYFTRDLVRKNYFTKDFVGENYLEKSVVETNYVPLEKYEEVVSRKGTIRIKVTLKADILILFDSLGFSIELKKGDHDSGQKNTIEIIGEGESKLSILNEEKRRGKFESRGRSFDLSVEHPSLDASVVIIEESRGFLGWFGL